MFEISINGTTNFQKVKTISISAYHVYTHNDNDINKDKFPYCIFNYQRLPKNKILSNTVKPNCVKLVLLWWIRFEKIFCWTETMKVIWKFALYGTFIVITIIISVHTGTLWSEGYPIYLCLVAVYPLHPPATHLQLDYNISFNILLISLCNTICDGCIGTNRILCSNTSMRTSRVCN